MDGIQNHNTVKNISFILGTGTCRAINAIKDKSDQFDAQYKASDKISVKDYVLNLANTIGRSGAKFLTQTVGAAKDITKTEGFSKAKEYVKESYNEIRDGYSKRLSDSIDKVEKEQAKGGEKEGFEKFSLGFRSMMNTIGKTVGLVCSKGEQFISKSVTAISAGLEETKKTSAYQKLIAEKNKSDEKDSGVSVETAEYV